MIRTMIEKQEGAVFDRAHFATFGSYSLNFEVVYFIASAEYIHYMDIQQAINLKIINKFAEEGIEFAYPTQTVFRR